MCGYAPGEEEGEEVYNGGTCVCEHVHVQCVQREPRNAINTLDEI
jgi:hypothetical protein